MLCKITGAFGLFVGAFLSLASTPANAVDYYWASGSGNWNSTSWSDTAGGAPIFGPPDNIAYVYNWGPSNVTVDAAGGGAARVYIDAFGAGAITVQQSQSSFGGSSLWLGTGGTVGNVGAARVDQSGGSQGFYGLNVGTNGVYNLSGGSSSSGGGLELYGSVNQTGGTRVNGETMNIYATGTYNLSAGEVVAGSATVGGTFNQTGGLNMGATTYRTFGIGGTYNLEGGTFRGDIISNSGAFNFTGGTLSFNSFSGNLINNGGTLAAGISPHSSYPSNLPLGITNNYTQKPSGKYAVDIGGLLADTQYDVLNVGGTASLNGLLSVSLADLGGGIFAPKSGDIFDILRAEYLTGSFSELSLPTLGQDLGWRVSYLTDAFGSTDVVRLSVNPVPEPETYVLLLAGLALLGFAVRRNNKSAYTAAA